MVVPIIVYMKLIVMSRIPWIDERERGSVHTFPKGLPNSHKNVSHIHGKVISSHSKGLKGAQGNL